MLVKILGRSVVTVDRGQVVEVDELQGEALIRSKLGEPAQPTILDQAETPKKRYRSRPSEPPEPNEPTDPSDPSDSAA